MNYAVIFAGGTGTRMGNSIPKQFLLIGNETILGRTIRVFNNCKMIDKILVVTLKDYIQNVREIISEQRFDKVLDVISGGQSAFESQRLGVFYLVDNNVCKDEDIVVVHDGVRPLITTDLIEKCILKAKQENNCIVVNPAFETIAVIGDDHKIVKTIPRQECLIARAPQVFHLEDLYNAHRLALINKIEYIDSASMFLDQGVELNPFVGPVENIKITTQFDYMLAKLLMENKQ